MAVPQSPSSLGISSGISPGKGSQAWPVEVVVPQATAPLPAAGVPSPWTEQQSSVPAQVILLSFPLELGAGGHSWFSFSVSSSFFRFLDLYEVQGRLYKLGGGRRKSMRTRHLLCRDHKAALPWRRPLCLLSRPE